MKADLKKEVPTYTAPRGRFEVVTVAPAQFLMVDGHGDPNTSSAYADALAALYPLAYALKFLSKTELGRDYVVMPLEGLWWSEQMDAFARARDKSRWDWTLLNLVPGWLTAGHVDLARADVARKRGPASLPPVRFERYDEGLSVQTLHVGSYDDEAPVLAAMHAWIADQGMRLLGKHHEIYLSNPRRVAPERLRTILRQPVMRAD
ncbi:GyrI-like domain-containing protein [Cellulomonas alba]|uniref:GyrI-like domain-containing protein n=1 Tax=Cellulomonas alba TaxID=3053467 RepID=A0ABT7SED3_9CELL|nr:GyrI-like domain-containing protein [Cellulomonas alba]MDM7854532.1 GyrI-like domain-containing protein [Cellulomonas alba]